MNERVVLAVVSSSVQPYLRRSGIAPILVMARAAFYKYD